MQSDTKGTDGFTIARDYRGVQCPMNFARITVDLMDLKIGDRLHVLIDDGEPANNVPRSIEREGQRIIEKTNMGSYWSVIIEKVVD